jgi:hypothetical protein
MAKCCLSILSGQACGLILIWTDLQFFANFEGFRQNALAPTGQLSIKPFMDDVIATLEPSLGRRWFGAIALAALGVLLIWIAFARPPEALALKIITPVLGALFIWQAQWNLRVSKTRLYLTKHGLFDGDDTLIVASANMLEVDRGIFAFKPSNGFLIRLHEPEPKGWAPGLYWRLGRRLGVGGATQLTQNKAMAEAIQVLIMERSLGPDIA